MTTHPVGSSPPNIQFPLDEIFLRAFDAVILTDSAQVIQHFNQGAERIFGYESQEVIGKPLDILLPERFIPAHRKHMAGFASSPDRARPMGHAARHIIGQRKNGDEFTAEATITKAVAQGQTYLAVFMRDLSEFARTKQALEESQSIFSQVVESLNEGIVIQDQDGKIIHANASASRILGLNIEQMNGRTSFDAHWNAIHEDGSPFPGEEHPAMLTLRTGQPQTGVVMGIQIPDGELTWILINTRSLFHKDAHQPYAVVASFTDITAQRQAEQALIQTNQELENRVVQRTAELLQTNQQLQIEITRVSDIEATLRARDQRLTALMDAIPDVIVQIDRDGNVIDVHQAPGAHIPLDSHQNLGRNLQDFLPASEYGLVLKAIQVALDKNTIQTIEHDYILDDGTHNRVELRISPMPDMQTLALIRNVTERDKAEEALRQAHAQQRNLLSELQQRDTDMGIISEMNDMLLTCQSLQEASEVISLSCQKLFGSQPGGLALLQNTDGQFLETVAAWGDDNRLLPVFAVDSCWAMRRGQPHERSSFQANVACRHFSSLPEYGTMCLPLSARGETLGLLYLQSTKNCTNEQRQRLKQLLVTLGETIKLAVANIQLRQNLSEQAVRDVLTGLYNRRYLMEKLPMEVQRARRSGQPLVVAMLDLDHFKKVNDTYGHDMGDLLLREVGRKLQSGVRATDYACRLGGEEFCLIFVGADLSDVTARLEELRKKIAALEINIGSQHLANITISSGVTQALPESTPAELLTTADQALYRAKQNGRNRIEVNK